MVFFAGVVGGCSILRRLTFENALWLTIFETVEVRKEPLLPYNRCLLAINCTSRYNPLDSRWKNPECRMFLTEMSESAYAVC
jgi:hypothetical protein